MIPFIVYIGDAPTITTTVSNQDGPVDVSLAGSIVASVRSGDSRRTLLPQVTVTQLGGPTDDWTNGKIAVVFSATDTQKCRTVTEDARLRVTIDDITYESHRGAVAIRARA